MVPAIMEIALIDALPPFFRGDPKRRINWSKIPFDRLPHSGEGMRERWDQIARDLVHFADSVKALGYNSVTLDDVPHLSDHPWFGEKILEQNRVWRAEFAKLFALLKAKDLKVYVTCDYLTTSPEADQKIGASPSAARNWFAELLAQFLDDFPEVSGVVLRIGESDGLDVEDRLSSRLMLRTAREVNQLLVHILPLFEQRKRRLIFRTWTVGAYLIGDLIWHRGRIATVFQGIRSEALVVSMKYGESDFFRYLPLNRHFFRIDLPKIIEFQARREYEGAGEYPSFVGWETATLAGELASAPNVIGFSVWCQTGGWHRFRRLAFLENKDLWIRLNCAVIAAIFQKGQTVEAAIEDFFGEERAAGVREFLRLADSLVREVLYVEEFARQKLFFRRVRIPPLLSVYWDCIFINGAVRRILHHFVRDPEAAIRTAEAHMATFPRMEELAEELGLPVEDVRFMRDSFQMICLARRYFFLPDDPAMLEAIAKAKSEYKRAWPKENRPRYRIKLDSSVSNRFSQLSFQWLARLLIRQRRGYRPLLDRIFTLIILSRIFFFFRVRHETAIPKFLRKTAMGIDSLFR